MSDLWARRKAAVAKEAEAEIAEARAARLAQAETALADRSDAEILDELKLCPPEELESAEAVRHFLTQAVPQRLKTRALRRLWRLNPVLANLDGLVDYGEDFTDSATVIENLQTAYQVGKGMLQHIEELARQAEDTDVAEVEAEDPVEDIAEPAIVIAAVAPPPPEDPIKEEGIAPLPARRMQFRFEETI